MSERSHAERVRLGRLGAYVLHSQYDSRKLTRAAQQAFWSKFERDVDPEGVLPIGERFRRAEMARKAYFTRLALKSAKVRRQKRERNEQALARRTADLG